MGVTFRSGGYIRHVFIGGRTIKDGEAAAIWNAKGEHRQIIGPKREWMTNSTIRFLTRHKAESHQYLKISHCDGRVEHKSGPATMYENPAYHDSISVEDGYRLGSRSECLVTFCNSNINKNENENRCSNNSDSRSKGTTAIGILSSLSSSTPSTSENIVSTRVFRGPTLFIPKPSEYVHEFVWSDTEHYNSQTQPTSKFSILHTSGTILLRVTIPTIDGFSFDATLIVPYNIHIPLDADAVLLQNNVDVTKELYNGLLFDTQLLGDSFSSELLKSKKEDVVSALSKIETYPSMVKAASKCGLDIGGGDGNSNGDVNDNSSFSSTIQVISIEFCSSLLDQIDQEQQLTANIQAQLAKKTLTSKISLMEMEEQRKKVDDGATLKQMQIIAEDALDVEHFKLKMDALERQATLELREAEVARGVRKVGDESLLELLGRVKQLGVDMTKLMTTEGGMSVLAGIGSPAVLKVNHLEKRRQTRLNKKVET